MSINWDYREERIGQCEAVTLGARHGDPYPHPHETCDDDTEPYSAYCNHHGGNEEFEAHLEHWLEALVDDPDHPTDDDITTMLTPHQVFALRAATRAGELDYDTIKEYAA